MTRRNISKPAETISLKLSTEERQLLLDLTFVEEEILHRIRRTPSDEVDIQLSLDQLGSLAGSVAADANHTSDKTRGAKLARIYEKIDFLLNAHLEDRSATEPEDDKLPSVFPHLGDHLRTGRPFSCPTSCVPLAGPSSLARDPHVALGRWLRRRCRAVLLGILAPSVTARPDHGGLVPVTQRGFAQGAI